MKLEHKNQHAVFIHANTSDGIKIPTFFWKKLGMMFILVQCPFNAWCIVLQKACYDIQYHQYYTQCYERSMVTVWWMIFAMVKYRS